MIIYQLALKVQQKWGSISSKEIISAAEKSDIESEEETGNHLVRGTMTLL